MENKFKVGTNFDVELVPAIQELNKNAKIGLVTELYGSIQLHAKFAARPDFRLPDVSLEELEAHVQQAKDAGIDFNYTLNTPRVGSKLETLEMIEEIKELISYLDNIGVARITVADMLLLDVIYNHCEYSFGIEISTIAHIDTVTQMKYLRDKYKVDKICNNVMKNRSIDFLRNAAEYCNSNGVSLELMVNEFCGVGDEISTTHCVFRDSCYLSHATNKTKEDAQAYKLYPMNKCMASRNAHSASWLKTRFVLPEDIACYNSFGVNNWKITGRTGTTEYLIKVIGYYLQGIFEGNLLELWKPLTTIYNNKTEAETKHATNIPTETLNGFLDKWLDDERFECANELCGVTCRHCDDWYANHVVR